MAANKKREPSRDKKRRSRRGETTPLTRSKMCIVCGDAMEWIRGKKQSYWLCPNCQNRQ